MDTSVSLVESLAATGPAAAPRSRVARAEMGRPFGQIVEDVSTREIQAKQQPDSVRSGERVSAGESDRNRDKPNSRVSDQAGQPRSSGRGEKKPRAVQQGGESAPLVPSEQAQADRLAAAEAPSTLSQTSLAAPGASSPAAEGVPDDAKMQPVQGDGGAHAPESELASRGPASAEPELAASTDGRPGGWTSQIGDDGEPRLDEHAVAHSQGGAARVVASPATGNPDTAAPKHPEEIEQTVGQKQGGASHTPSSDAQPVAARQEAVLGQGPPQAPNAPGRADTGSATGGRRLPAPSQDSQATRAEANQSDNRQYLRLESSAIPHERNKDAQSNPASTVGQRDVAGRLTEGTAVTHDVPRTSESQPGQVPTAVVGRESSRSVSEQILDSLGASVQRGQQNILIRLNPPELGRVWVTLRQQEGQVIGLLEADRGETRRQIDQVLPEVIRCLEDSGVQVRRLEVSHADLGSRQAAKDGLGSQQDWAQQRDLSQNHGQPQPRPEPRPVGSPTPRQETVVGFSAPRIETGTGRLNTLI